jgi:anaerobic selenocysteine-containing dehydrogenase
LGNRAVKPFGHAKEDWSIWAGIGQKLGLAEYFPWENSEELVAYLLKGSNITLDQLRQNPGGYVYVEREYRKYEKSGFNTPSKKVEFYSCDLEKYGYDPLPTFHEPAESPISRPDLAKQYPLLFVGGPRRYNYFHSQFRNIPSLRSRLPEPLLEMNPETAKALGIRRGDMVRVESSRGTITVKAKMTGDVHPEVVTMEHGWSEANANLLTSDEARDPISGYPAFRQVLCRVNRVS